MNVAVTAPPVYPARLEPDANGGYVVTFPDFESGVTQGDTREEALDQAADLLETMVANYMAEDWDLPDPSPAMGGRWCRWRRSSPRRLSFTARCANPG